jgi:hypothetical protein
MDMAKTILTSNGAWNHSAGKTTPVAPMISPMISPTIAPGKMVTNPVCQNHVNFRLMVNRPGYGDLLTTEARRTQRC